MPQYLNAFAVNGRVTGVTHAWLSNACEPAVPKLGRDFVCKSSLSIQVQKGGGDPGVGPGDYVSTKPARPARPPLHVEQRPPNPAPIPVLCRDIAGASLARECTVGAVEMLEFSLEQLPPPIDRTERSTAEVGTQRSSRVSNRLCRATNLLLERFGDSLLNIDWGLRAVESGRLLCTATNRQEKDHKRISFCEFFLEGLVTRAWFHLHQK